MSVPPSIAGVIVTFHPDAEFEQRLEIITRQANPLIVVDNTGAQSVQSRVEVACALHGAHLITNRENRGLAAALNQAFALLVERGVHSAIAFDQDSTPAAGFTAALLATAAQQPAHAVVGANWCDEARPDFASRHLRRHRVPFLFERTPATRDLANVTCVITSGSLFELGTWRRLGGFNEGLFVDLVDTDYCLRASAIGGKITVAAGARLAHRRGAKQPVRLLGRTWWPAFMSPLRLRYLFRNRVRLVFRHGWHAPHWVVFETVYAVKILAEILFLEDRKWTKLAACARGTWDGLAGASGAIPST